MTIFLLGCIGRICPLLTVTDITALQCPSVHLRAGRPDSLPIESLFIWYNYKFYYTKLEQPPIQTPIFCGCNWLCPVVKRRLYPSFPHSVIVRGLDTSAHYQINISFNFVSLQYISEKFLRKIHFFSIPIKLKKTLSHVIQLYRISSNYVDLLNKYAIALRNHQLYTELSLWRQIFLPLVFFGFRKFWCFFPSARAHGGKDAQQDAIPGL